MKSILGREVQIGDKQGEITDIKGVGYEISFFNSNDGKAFVDAREIEKYLVKSDAGHTGQSKENVFLVFEYGKRTDVLVGCYRNEEDAKKKHAERPTFRYIETRKLE